MNKDEKPLRNTHEWTHEGLFATDFAVLFAEDLPVEIIEQLKTDWFYSVGDLLLAGRDGLLKVLEYDDAVVEEIEQAMTKHNLGWSSVELIDGKKLDCTELKYTDAFVDKILQVSGICILGDLINYTEKQLWQIFYNELITSQERTKRRLCERIAAMYVQQVQKSLGEWHLQLKSNTKA